MKTKVLPYRNFLIFVFVGLLQMTIVKPVSSQSQKMAFADWLSTTGSQNYFHKGVTKTDGSGNVYIVLIIDVNGKVVMSETFENCLGDITKTLNVSSLKSEMYLVNISSSSCSFSKIFIKQ